MHDTLDASGSSDWPDPAGSETAGGGGDAAAVAGNGRDARSIAALVSGSGLPVRDARMLLAAALGVKLETLVAHPDRTVPLEAAETFADHVAQLRDGVPLAYLLGTQPFMGREFRVNRHVLVPRPETELLVETALARLKRTVWPRVADLGTGSGCIAISIALARPDAHVIGVDASADALDVAVLNDRRYEARVGWQQGSWYDALSPNERFDAILANPPYIAPGDPHLPTLRHEPRSALVSGRDGLDDLRRVVAGAPARMAPGGWLMVEHGFDQSEAVQALFTAAGLLQVEALLDGAGIARVVAGRRAGGR
jgi:release factor glutamine methyltransferase